GQAADVTQAEALIAGVPFEVAVADRGYDKQELVDRIEARGAAAVIPTRKNRKEQRDVDWERYKDRTIAERFWSKIKQYRRGGTPYDKTDGCYLGVVHLAAIMGMLREPPGPRPPTCCSHHPEHQGIWRRFSRFAGRHAECGLRVTSSEAGGAGAQCSRMIWYVAFLPVTTSARTPAPGRSGNGADSTAAQARPTRRPSGSVATAGSSRSSRAVAKPCRRGAVHLTPTR